MLEEQLQRARKRGDHVLELESEIIKYKQQVNDLALEREANHEKLQELFEENAQLQLLTKSALNDNTVCDIDSDSTEDVDGGVWKRFDKIVCVSFYYAHELCTAFYSLLIHSEFFSTISKVQNKVII